MYAFVKVMDPNKVFLQPPDQCNYTTQVICDFWEINSYKYIWTMEKLGICINPILHTGFRDSCFYMWCFINHTGFHRYGSLTMLKFSLPNGFPFNVMKKSAKVLNRPQSKNYRDSPLPISKHNMWCSRVC